MICVPMPSAQVKTAVLLAGLYADGVTRVKESIPSRNHTELALESFGASPVVRPGEIEIRSPASLSAGRHRIPGDFSSAAFFMGAAAFLTGSELVVENVGLNPTRAAFLEALRRMGADVEIQRIGEERDQAMRLLDATLRRRVVRASDFVVRVMRAVRGAFASSVDVPPGSNDR